jgi:transcriptional regulator with XRE-family HTH domain
MERSPGDIIRYWRKNRGFSQMALAELLDISFKHLNFIENNKSNASRKLLVRLGEVLKLSLRARNALLSSAGHSPEYSQLDLSADQNQQARELLESILRALDPNPALIIDQGLNILMCNRAMDLIIDLFAANPNALRAEPLTVPRLNFHQDGLRDAIVQKQLTVGGHLGRLHRSMESSHFHYEDLGHYRELRALASEIGEDLDSVEIERPQLIIPIELQRGEYRVSLYTAITSLGSPQDVTLQELVIDSGFPADDHTRQFLAEQLKLGEATTG